MKRTFYVVLIALAGLSCQKETAPEPTADLKFYIDKPTLVPIDIYLDGVAKGTLYSVSYPTGVDCSTTLGVVTIALPVGNYNWSAQTRSGSKKWSNKASMAGECKRILLAQ